MKGANAIGIWVTFQGLKSEAKAAESFSAPSFRNSSLAPIPKPVLIPARQPRLACEPAR